MIYAWLLTLGVLVGVMATLSYQAYQDRPRRLLMDDYTARLRALDRSTIDPTEGVLFDRFRELESPRRIE